LIRRQLQRQIPGTLIESELLWSKESGKGPRLVRIPAMPNANSKLMAFSIPKDGDHRRSEATLDFSYHAEVIGIRQCF